MRRGLWRQQALTPSVLVLAVVLALHALFALALLYEMQLKPLRVVQVRTHAEQALSVRFIDAPSTPKAAPPPTPPPPALASPPQATPPRARPVVHEPPHADAMVVQDHQAAPAPASSAATSLFAKDGSVHLPPSGTYTPPKAVAAQPAKPADDRQIMQHDSNHMHYKATRYEKYFPPPDETAGGAVGRHVGDALKAIAKSICDPTKASTASNMLCGADPPPPSPIDGDARLNLPPPTALADDPHAPSVASCIAEYNQTKPLSSGCPANTPALAFKAEMRECIDLYRAGKRLKTWCPADTAERAAKETAAAGASSTGAH